MCSLNAFPLLHRDIMAALQALRNSADAEKDAATASACKVRPHGCPTTMQEGFHCECLAVTTTVHATYSKVFGCSQQ